MREPPASSRVFVTGGTGSGKSTLLRRSLLPQVPRAIIVDPVGEFRRERFKDRNARVFDLAEIPGALRTLTRRERWRLVADIPASSFPILARSLVPERLAVEPSLALAVGGCTLVCDEIHTIASHSAPQEVQELWQRGRHVGLSILAATQRPAKVSRTVTSMSQVLIACQTHEPADLAYLRDIFPRSVHQELQELARYHALVWRVQDGCGALLAPDGSVLRRFGRPIAEM